MKKPTEIIKTHTLILGAGPAGLAAAYALAKAGTPPLVIEKGKVSGGLMRSIQHGEYVVDVGRKELYTRIQKVDALWNEVLGADYVSYNHREGVLYKGTILESSNAWRGSLRGMSLTMLLACAFDYIWDFTKFSMFKPRNYEEYWYRKRGCKFSHIFTQGYEEKFKGIKWKEMPIPTENTVNTNRLATEHHAERNKKIWRHPAKGSGQICEILEKEIYAMGGKFAFESKIVEINTCGKRIDTIKISTGSEIIAYQPEHVISSMPVEFLGQYLNLSDYPSNLKEKNTKIGSSSGRSTICVYLFLDELPRFPHVWLKVTSPDIKAGRITNYAALSQAMVPEGKTSLCVEYFCDASDALLSFNDEALKELALSECAVSGLIDPKTYLNSFILKLPGANAATSWRDWANNSIRSLLQKIGEFENLYNINRPGTDKATYAGLEAAQAILDGDRKIFHEEMSLTLPDIS
ncbi:MAG: NAD(P)-binding protein [Betaproteobacteria bacterium]|nr:NAD(P)-binding protein [Betaproteobacteria bacterium]